MRENDKVVYKKTTALKSDCQDLPNHPVNGLTASEHKDIEKQENSTGCKIVYKSAAALNGTCLPLPYHPALGMSFPVRNKYNKILSQIPIVDEGLCNPCVVNGVYPKPLPDHVKKKLCLQ